MKQPRSPPWLARNVALACVCTILAVPAAVAAPDAGDLRALVVRDPQPLGLFLDDDLVVTGFQSRGGPFIAERSGVVHVGSRLAAVNDRDVSSLGVLDALRILHNAPFPRTLAFRPRTRDAGEQPQPAVPGDAAQTRAVNVTLQVGARVLSQFAGMRAEFGPPFSPSPRPVVAAKPELACGALQNARAVRGAYALVQRGVCTFMAKASALEAAGAAGVVVINSDDRTFSPPAGDSSVDPPRIPTLLVSRRDGLALLQRIGQRHGGTSTVQVAVLEAQPQSAQPPPPADASSAGQAPSGQPVGLSVDTVPASVPAGELTLAADDLHALAAAGEAPRHVDFLSATFGAAFPVGELWLEAARPLHGCSAMPRRSGEAIVLLASLADGQCSAAEKALAAQAAGAAALLLVMPPRQPLQHLDAASAAAEDAEVTEVAVPAQGWADGGIGAPTEAEAAVHAAARRVRIGVAAVTASAGGFLRTALRTVGSAAEGRVQLLSQGRPGHEHHWQELRDLLAHDGVLQQMQRASERDRRRLVKRLARKHGQGQAGGSWDRHEVLQAWLDSLEVAQQQEE